VRSEAGPGTLYVMVQTSATTPVTSGGSCIGSLPCYDDYQTLIQVGPTWSEQFIPFSLLTQQGWGQPVIFDSRTLVGVNFQTTQAGGESFSFSVDQISFFSSVPSPPPPI
jgi:hypothetical protein